MIKIIVSLMVLLSAVSPLKTKDFAVYLCIGQSNMAGRGKIEEQDKTPLEGVYLLNDEGVPVPAQAPLNKYSTIRKGLSMQGINPAWSFARKMHEVTGRNILLVVNAKGGTSINLWTKDAPCDTKHVANETWPDRKQAPQFYAEAVRRTRQAMCYGKLEGILWHQGESDARSEKSRNSYMDKLAGLVNDLRSDLKADVPFIAGEVLRTGSSTAINPILNKISARIPKSACVSSEDLPSNPDNIHFSREGQIRLGERYADAMLSCQYSSLRWEREPLWTKKNMPDSQSGQIAEMTVVSNAPGFNADKHRIPYLEWFEAPADSIRTGACMILISGGGYSSCCDMEPVRRWHEKLTAAGIQCVSLVYRTPRPVGLPYYQTAWEDGQRAVRMVRSEAAARGYDPERIGVISMSAGSHLGLLLATSSQTPAYRSVDKLDSIPCHINWGVLHAPAYATTDGLGHAADREGYGPDVKLDSIFRFDAKTCPLSLHHGEYDPYSPNGSTLVYRELRKKDIPAELHLYPDRKHGVFGIERGIEFIRQMGFLGELGKEEALVDRFSTDNAGATVCREDIWPEGKMCDPQEGQCLPYIEWHIPAVLKTTAIQIIYSGGGYKRNNPESYEVAPFMHYLNDLGMTVVTMKYRTPRPSPESGLAKHVSAWEDLQRAIRVVRSEAAGRGLDPDRIGIMGSSAGGHLTVMGVTSSRHSAYRAVDDIDKLPCNVQWGIAYYPAYILTDGLNGGNSTKGNDSSAVISGEFSFDPATAPMLLLHGDADGFSPMGSVQIWEKMRSMGVACELHTYATRKHCFQKTASPGTGSHSSIDRIGDFLRHIKVLP